MSGSAVSGATIEHEIGPRGRFTLRQAAGDIRIRGVEGALARVRLVDDDRPLSDLFEIDAGKGHLELRQRESGGLAGRLFNRGASPEIEVDVPHGAGVEVETASADVRASDLSGTKRFRAASGDIDLARLAGEVSVETVSGDVELDGTAPVDLAAKSVSGDVHVQVPTLRRLEMSTTSGDLLVDAELAGPGPFTIRSISGDVTVVGRGGFRVEAETITGDLSSDLPSKRESLPGRTVLVVGRPGPTLSFRSVSGDFHVTRSRDEARAAEPAENGAHVATPPSAGPTAGPASAGGADAASLEILRALERGDITVTEATRRLGELDGSDR